MVGDQKERQVAVGIAIITKNRIIVEARMEIFNHPYIQVLNVWELDERGRKKTRRRRVGNVYDNYLPADQVWTGVGSNTRRRTLANTEWDCIIKSRVVILGDFNTHSPE